MKHCNGEISVDVFRKLSSEKLALRVEIWNCLFFADIIKEVEFQDNIKILYYQPHTQMERTF